MRRRGLFDLFRNSDGAAAVEFALILPVLIVLYFGTVEAASLYTVDRRVSTVAATVGDLVSRVDGSITTSTLNDYFQAANGIIAPYSNVGLKQVVSVLTVSSAGAVTVSWSRAYNGGTARAANSSYPLAATTQTNQLARGGWLVVSEVTYSYKPVYGMVIPNTINMKRVEYYLPRYDAYIAIN
jgi:Flp pilus assembly protein TadG